MHPESCEKLQDCSTAVPLKTNSETDSVHESLISAQETDPTLLPLFDSASSNVLDASPK